MQTHYEMTSSSEYESHEEHTPHQHYHQAIDYLVMPLQHEQLVVMHHI